MSEKNIKLVIAEKLSVAQSIAKVIGADKRERTDTWRAMVILSAGVWGIWWSLHHQSPMMRNMKSGDMMIFQFCHSSAYGFLLWKTRRFRMAFLI